MEGDASSASYFLAGAAVTGGTVTVEGCGTSSLQVFLVPLSHWGQSHSRLFHLVLGICDSTIMLPISLLLTSLIL